MRSQIKKMQGHTEHLLDSFIDLKEKYAMLKPVVYNEELRNQFSGSRLHGLNIMRNILFLSCSIDIANICLESGTNSASIAKIMSTIVDKQIVDKLRESFADRELLPASNNEAEIPTDVLLMHHEKRKNEYRNIFDKSFFKLNDLWSSFIQSGVPNKFRMIRDKIAAHKELRFENGKYRPIDANALGIRWKDLDAAINTIQQLIEHINNIVRRAGFAWDHFEEQLEKASRGFWGQPTTRT
jgi:hypothetical protein